MLFLLTSVVIAGVWFNGKHYINTLAYYRNLYHSKCLPYSIEAFIGRENEMKEVMELVDFDNSKLRIVSIVGPPGIGKSTLAIHVGHDMVAQGVVVYHVDMVEVSSMQSLAEKVLDCDETLVSTKNVTIDRLIKWARDLHHRTLLILDNCDDILHRQKETLQKMVKRLLGSSNELKIMMTSRQRAMQLSQFKMYALRELSVEASCNLLRIVTRQLNSTLCESIANLTGNVPLALQVVGALLNQPDPPDPMTIIHNLEKQLISTLSPEELLPEERVNASISLSYQYLDEKLQKFGRYFANFPGSFSKETSCEIMLSFAQNPVTCGYNSKLIYKLVQRSLLEYNQRSGRYQFHRLIREFFLDIQKSMGSVGLDESEQFSSEFRTHYAQMLYTLTAAFSTKALHKMALTSLDIERHNIQHLLYHVENFQVIHSIEVAMSQNFLQCRFTRDELVGPLQSSVRYIAENWKLISTDAQFFGIYTELLTILGKLHNATLAIYIFTSHSGTVENIRAHIPGKEGAIPYIRFYNQLSLYYIILEQHDGVKMCHERILQAQDQLNECEPGTCDYISIGNIHYNLENYESSAYFHELALKLQEMDVITKARIMITLHNSYQNIHREQKAASITEEAVALFPSLMNVSSGECFRHYDKLEKIARFYSVKGRMREAHGIEEMQLDVLLELAGTQPDGEIASRGINYAMSLLDRGDYDKAITMAECFTKLHEAYIDLLTIDMDELFNDTLALMRAEPHEQNEMLESQREQVKLNKRRLESQWERVKLNKRRLESQWERVKLNKWELIAKIKIRAGNYSEGLEYFELVANFIFERNKATIYASQLSHACLSLIYHGHLKCLNYVITETVFSTGKWIVYGVFGTLFNIDIDALLPEPPEIVDEQLSRLSSFRELDPPKLHEPSIRHWMDLPLSRSWLQHIIIVTSSIKQALVDINLLRFMVKCILKCLLFSVEVIGVVVRLYLVYYSIQLVVHWTLVCAQRTADGLVYCVCIVLIYIMVLQV